MEYRFLGKTGLKVSELCLGALTFGREADEPDSRAMMDRFVEAGGNFIDTADVYGAGESEAVVGRWIKDRVRDDLVIATKVRYPMRGDAPNMGGLSRKHVIQGCEASLQRLGLETIDLYQLHRFDPGTPIEETLEALDLLVKQGKVRYLGASSTFAWRLMKALAHSDARGLARFVSMQDHYNLVYREEEREMIPLCREEGIGVIPWSPLARGRLARPAGAATPRMFGDAGMADQLYDHPSDESVIEANRRVATARGVSPAETALAWLLSRPGVTAPIIGATKLEHLETAAKAVDLELTAEEIRTMEAPYQPHAVRGWIQA